MSVAIAYTQGPPFREAIYKNIHYMIAIACGMVGQLLLLFAPNLFNFMQLEIEFPLYFKLQLLIINIIIGLIIVAYEKSVTAKLNEKYAEGEINLSN